MAMTRSLDLAIWRNDDVYELPIQVRGLDLTNVALAAQIRGCRDNPLLLANLAKVVNGNAEGLRVAGVTVDGGVPVTDLRLRLNKGTRQGLPYTGEMGDDTALEWALLIAGKTRLVGKVWVLAHAFGSDAAPMNRPAAYGVQRAGVMPSGAASLTFAGEDIVALSIDGADVAVAAGDRAEIARTAAEGQAVRAEAGAQSALATTRYFTSRAAGEAGSTTGQLFATDDGAGNIIFYKRTVGGSVEVGRQLTPADFATRLAASSAAAGTGYLATGASALPFTVADVLNRTVWVETFGARGDGATDCTTAFERAVAACPPGGVIRCAGGTYIAERQWNINRNDFTFEGGGSTIRAKAGVDFEWVMKAQNCSRITFRATIFDANGLNRTASQTIRYGGSAMYDCDDAVYDRCTGRGARGFSNQLGNMIPGVGLGFSGVNRSRFDDCTVIDNGTASNPADGFYASGDDIQNNNPTCVNCTDTGAVIENSNNSIINGGTARGCSAGAAISNATNDTKRGNSVKGMVIKDWNSSVTGGVQILAALGGDLVDTTVDVTLVTEVAASRGNGPAINLRRSGTGRIRRISIRAIIDGASEQGILVDAWDATVEAIVQNVNGACVLVQHDSARAIVSRSLLNGGTTGVFVSDTAMAITSGNLIFGQSGYGLFAANTASLIYGQDTIYGQGIDRAGKDAGAKLSGMMRVEAAAGIGTASALMLDGKGLLFPQAAALPQAATDLASALPLLNRIREGLTSGGPGHGLFAAP